VTCSYPDHALSRAERSEPGSGSISGVRDVRVVAVGDSFVAGVGDPEYRGWLGRVAAATDRSLVALTVYNLGVRRDTSVDVAARWRAECSARSAGAENRLLISFGVNDTAIEDAVGRRVPTATSEHNLRTLIAAARVMGLEVLVVGPPPVEHETQNARIRVLDRRFAAVCQDAAVGYVAVFDGLDRDPTWRVEVARGDGSHPGAAG